MLSYFETFPLSAAERLGRRPEIGEILQHWTQLNAEGTATYARIWPLIEHYIPHIALYERVEGDYFFLLFGQQLRQQTRDDHTGKFLTEVPQGDLIKRLRRAYDGVLSSGDPLYLRSTYDNGETVDFYERLVLPVTWHRTGQRRLLMCPTFLYKPDSDVLQEMFEKSPAALLVALPVGSSLGRPTDGWVIMANTRARVLTRSDERNGPDGVQTIRTLLPELDDGAWRAVFESTARVTSLTVSINGALCPMRIEKLLDFLVIRIETV